MDEIHTDNDGDLWQRRKRLGDPGYVVGPDYAVVSGVEDTNHFDKYGWPLQTWMLDDNRIAGFQRYALPLNWWLI